MSWEATAVALARRVEELEAEVWYLRDQLDLPALDLVTLRERLGLRPTGAAILLRLYRAAGRYVSTEQLAVTVNTQAEDADNLVKVQVHYLRKTIGRDAIAVLAGTGYRLSKRGLALVDATLQGDNRAENLDTPQLSAGHSCPSA